MANPYQPPSSPIWHQLPAPERPWQVKASTFSLAGISTLNIISLYFFSDLSINDVDFLFAYAAVNIFMLSVLVFFFNGKNWARYLYVVMMLLEMCKRFWFLSVVWDHSKVHSMIVIATVLCELSAVVLLLSKKSSAWYMEMKRLNRPEF
jgi:hypothetical protein